MTNKELAAQILDLIGGKENVSSVTHCITRLRVIAKNVSIIKGEEIKKLPGVMGINLVGEQYQVILGGKVTDVYKEFVALVGEAAAQEKAPAADAPAQKKKPLNLVMDTLTGIFVPILPQ